MKAHFLKLFDYDFQTNQTMIDTEEQGISSEKATQLLAHIFAAKQVWLHRLSGSPAAVGAVLWPDWPLNTLTERNHQLHKEWLMFLNDENDFDRLVDYRNLAGDPFTASLTDILTHVINHGTHHRAQAGQHLKLAGMEKLPVTDFIYYTLSHSK